MGVIKKISLVTMLIALSSLALAHKPNDPDYLFDLSFEELLSVKVVTAGKKPEKIADIPASVVIVTREEIETYGYTTLSEIIENIPGFYKIDDYCYRSNFGVRGFWTDSPNRNVIIMINGVKQTFMLDLNHFFQKFSLPVEAIDRIEVVRGPMSVLYGGGAFFGVINIFTNSTLEEGGLNQISGSIGSSETRKAILRYEDSGEEYRLSAAGSVYGSHGIDEPYSKFGNSADGSTGGFLEEDEKSFIFSGSFKDVSIDFSYNENRSENMFLFVGADEGTQSFHSTTAISLGYQKELSKKVSFNVKLGYAVDRLWRSYDVLYPDFFGTQRTPSSSYNVEALLFCSPSKKQNITLGVSLNTILDVTNQFDLPGYSSPNLENTFTTLDGQDDIVTRAIFAQTDYQITDRISFVAGLRLEQMLGYGIVQEHATVDSGIYHYDKHYGGYDDEEINVIPRLALIYAINDHNILKLLYGSAINHPSFFQIESTTIRYDQQAPESEKIHTIEINHLASWLPWLTTSASFFHNSLDNLILRSTGFDNTGNYYSYFANSGDMESWGSELILQIYPTKKSRVYIGVTLQEVLNKNEADIEPGYYPHWLGYARGSYDISANVTASVISQYVHKMYSGWDSTPSIPSDPSSPPLGRFGEDIDSYITLGMNLRVKNLLQNGVSLNLRGSNLFDAEIRYPTTTNSTWAPKGTLGSGRSFLVSLGYQI